MKTEEDRKVARFDGGTHRHYVDIWTKRGGYVVLACSPLAAPLKGDRTDKMYVDTLADAMALAASTVQEMMREAR